MNELATVIAVAATAVGCIVTLLLLIFDESRRLLSRPKQSSSGRSVSVTIIIDTGSSVKSLGSLSQQLRRLRSKKVDVVLIRRNPVPTKKQLAAIAESSGVKTTIYSPRMTTNKSKLVRSAYSHGQKGELIITTNSLCADLKGAVELARRELALKGKVVDIRMLHGSKGFTGVVYSLQQSLERLYGGYKRIRFDPDLVSFTKTLAMPAGSVATNKKSRETLPISRQTLLSPGNAVRVRITKSPYRWLALLSICLVSFLLVVAVLSGEALEEFTFVWVATAIIGCVAVLFDSRLIWARRVAVLACAGFVPILLAISLMLIHNDNR